MTGNKIIFTDMYKKLLVKKFLQKEGKTKMWLMVINCSSKGYLISNSADRLVHSEFRTKHNLSNAFYDLPPLGKECEKVPYTVLFQ